MLGSQTLRHGLGSADRCNVMPWIGTCSKVYVTCCTVQVDAQQRGRYGNAQRDAVFDSRDVI